MHLPIWARSLPPDASRGGDLIACMAITITAAMILVGLRIYVRAKFVQSMGSDDWTILLAMVFGILTLATDAVKVSHGFGRHIDYLSPEQVSVILKYSIVGTITLIVSQGFAKISICFLLRRLLGEAVAPKRKFFIYLLIGFLSAYTLAVVIALLAQCTPTQRIWNRKVEGTCWHPSVVVGFAIMHGVCSTITALLLSTLPILILGNLKLNKRKKIAVLCVLGLGVFDGVCSIVRTVHTPHFNDRRDFTWTQIPLYLWANLEQNFAIIAACIPTLRPLFRFFDKSRSKSGGSSSNRRSTFPSFSTTVRKHGLGNHQGLPYRGGQLEMRGDDDEYALTEQGGHSESDIYSLKAGGGDSRGSPERGVKKEGQKGGFGHRVSEKIMKTTEITIRS